MLTICSVSYHSAPYLRLNKELMLGDYSEWIVAQNGPKEDLSEFSLIDGVERPKERPGFVGTGSYHHALALNKLVPLIHTKYVLFLDPDFFILPSLNDCISHMENNELVSFGAPYMIEPSKKRIQEVPTAFCIFLNLEKFNEIDFTPNNREDMVADTGVEIYTKLKGMQIDAAVPSHLGQAKYKTTEKSLKSIGIKTNERYDSYFWQDKLFGIHSHMKLHLKDEENRKRQMGQLKDIKKVIERARYLNV